MLVALVPEVCCYGFQKVSLIYWRWRRRPGSPFSTVYVHLHEVSVTTYLPILQRAVDHEEVLREDVVEVEAHDRVLLFFASYIHL